MGPAAAAVDRRLSPLRRSELLPDMHSASLLCCAFRVWEAWVFGLQTAGTKKDLPGVAAFEAYVRPCLCCTPSCTKSHESPSNNCQAGNRPTLCIYPKTPRQPPTLHPTALARSGCPHSGPAANVLGPEHVSGQWGESSMWRLAFGHETYRMRRDVGRSTMQ